MYHKCNIHSVSKYSSGISKQLSQDFQSGSHNFKFQSWSKTRVLTLGPASPIASSLGLPLPAAGYLGVGLSSGAVQWGPQEESSPLLGLSPTWVADLKFHP